MPAIFFAFVSYFSWGIGDILTVVVSRKIGALSTYFWFQSLALIVGIFLSPFFLKDLSGLTLDILLLNVGLAAILVIGSLSFDYGLKIGNASLVGTISASFSAVVVILSIFFLKESISQSQILAILIILAGVVLSTLNLSDLLNGKTKVGKGELFALITMVAWGIYFTFIQVPVLHIGWFWVSIISGVTGIALVCLVFLRGYKLNSPIKNKILLPLLGVVLLVKAAEGSFYFAVTHGQTFIVAPIAGAYPTLFVVLSFLIFKDPITRQQIIGIITTLIGIVLLSIFSV